MDLSGGADAKIFGFIRLGLRTFAATFKDSEVCISLSSSYPRQAVVNVSPPKCIWT